MAEQPKHEFDSGSSVESEEAASPAGAVFIPTTASERQAAVEQAFDFRGDVTVTKIDGAQLTGYLFDRDAEANPPACRLMLTEGGRATVRYDQIDRIELAQRDPAAGKSWETWVKKYAEKKLAERDAQPDTDHGHAAE